MFWRVFEGVDKGFLFAKKRGLFLVSLRGFGSKSSKIQAWLENRKLVETEALTSLLEAS